MGPQSLNSDTPPLFYGPPIWNTVFWSPQYRPPVFLHVKVRTELTISLDYVQQIRFPSLFAAIVRSFADFRRILFDSIRSRSFARSERSLCFHSSTTYFITFRKLIFFTFSRNFFYFKSCTIEKNNSARKTNIYEE